MSDIVRKGQSSVRRIVFRLLSLIWLLAGFAAIFTLAVFAQWQTLTVIVDDQLVSLLAITFFCFVLITLLVRYVRRFALVNLWAVVGFVVIAVGGTQMLVYVVVKLEAYPIFHIVLYSGTIAVMGIWVRIIKKLQYLRLAVVPFGITAEVEAAGHPQLELLPIDRPDIEVFPEKISGLVVDTMEPLTDVWVRYVTACRLAGYRIYQAEELLEAATGRISLSHLSLGIVDDFSGNMTYVPAKRLLDLIGVALSLPISIPLMFVTAVAIRIETPGPILFIQDRVGQGGRTFKILKFRSMTTDSETAGSQFTRENDNRITKVGALIRRFGLDELPQLWNILLGEMSLIGPRPEQPNFVRKFSEGIPFYDYRHTVKPGISGWAQVTLGYVADEKSTRDKLEFDLYYIKHQSFWLDMLIAMKTIRTVITGFGAR